MPRIQKVNLSEKLRVVEEYLSGKTFLTEAARQCNVNYATIRKWVSRYISEGVQGLVPTDRNKTYSRAIKLSAVLDYQSGKKTLLEICEIYKIKSDRQLRSWIKVYNNHGEFRKHSGGSHMIKRRNTTAAERLTIAQDCIRCNLNYAEIAHKYQVSYQQVYTWVKKYRVLGEAGLEDRRGRRAGTMPSRSPEEKLRDRIAQLERENLDLEMENALLKKVKELERRRR